MNNMLQVKKCNLARALSFSVLNSRTRTICFALLCSVFCILTGCKGKEEPVNPFVNPGTTENPNWVTGENNMTASMTAIVKVSFAQNEGTLAAFMGDKCCGIATYKADYGLYWLYISPATEAGGDVQLRFYSPDLKRIFVAKEVFPFHNDTQLGSITEPYTPEWTVAE